MRIRLPFLLLLAAGLILGQGINTQATPNDWEEINFDYDSSVLVDGFPSMLRIAELLRANPGHRVRVEGFTDGLGSEGYNRTLGLARANSVRDFLLKYGAAAGQVTTASSGEAAPRVAGQRSEFQRTDEARYMNRRVVLTVTDGLGNTIGAGSAGDAIRAISAQPGPVTMGPANCCDEILKRLDKLDEIAAAMKVLAEQNAELRRDLDALRQRGPVVAAATAPPAPVVAFSPPPPPPAPAVVAPAVSKWMQNTAFHVGADDRGKVAVSGRARVFAPLGKNAGVQAQGEYYYLHGQREGQFDLGLVERFHRRAQVGLFGSFKTITLAGNQTSGTLGQGSFVLDYFFGRGKIGLFASKAFRDNALINRANGVSETGLLQRNIVVERSLRVVEQIGISSTFALKGSMYAEANVGYLRSAASSNRAGGSLRFVFPMSERFAFTVEGGVNETYLPFQGTQQGRAAVGVQLGNFLRPRQYLAAEHAVPMEIPRVRYELVTRRVRTGNDAPVADAGPEMTNVPAGVVQLDGSGTYDPDADPITYQWTQEAGTTVTILNATAARASFTAAAGQVYAFRLLTKDNQGGQSSARVTISTGGGARVQILVFQSDPRQVSSGELSTLSWRVLNADSVTISGLGTVAPTGTRAVTPSATTTYVLTAKNSVSEETATTTVVINAAKFLYCFASPTNIRSGESTTLTWLSNGAQGVTITPGVGAVGANGSVAVSPTGNTTYTLTTTGASQTDVCSVSVSVTRGPVPTIARFSADQVTIENGLSSNLQWAVSNADSVTISTLGDVPLVGTREVRADDDHNLCADGDECVWHDHGSGHGKRVYDSAAADREFHGG